MNTKLLMTVSALFMAVMGILFSFLPQEIMAHFNIESNVITLLFLNLLSALYLGFGMLNWMSKGSYIGGIYNKPIAIGNLLHYAVGAIVLFKITANMGEHSSYIIPLTSIYIIFSILFFYVFKTNPEKKEEESGDL